MKDKDRAARRRIWRRIWHYLRHDRLLMGLSLLLAAVTVALSLVIPVLLGGAIDRMPGIGQVDFAAVIRLLLQAGVCAGVGALLQWVMTTVNNAVAFRVVRDMRRDAFRHLQQLPLSRIDRHPIGDIVSRLVNDIDQFADGLLLGFSQLFTGVITILGTLGFMLSVRPLIALAVVLLTPLSLVIAPFISRRSFRFFREQSEARGEQTAFIEEAVTHQKVVQAFGNEAQTAAQFAALNEQVRMTSLKSTFFSSLVNPTTRFVNNVVYAVVGLTGALAALGGGITVGGLSCLLNYAGQYAKPFNEISGVITELQNALACAGRFFELLDLPAESPAPDAALPTPAGTVALDRVSFSYLPEKPLIEDLSLTVRPGQHIALVGPTGCGKTTLINLLMRFYDVTGGAVSVDGTDIRAVSRHSLRAAYGMVLQDTWLRRGTVRENLLFGKPDATEEEMISAAQAAFAHGFITRLPQGYDTVLTEGGGELSAGQRQLLCIARVMLCRPPMLLLDEATSSIDARTEQKIQAAFDRLMAGRTAFIVAHRLSTVRQADVILVMRDGRIVEQGDHDSLLRQGGFYAQLYESQFAPTE